MSRRQSTRAGVQQTIAKAFTKLPKGAPTSARRPVEVALEHTVLSESLYQNSWDQHYETYCQGSSLLDKEAAAEAEVNRTARRSVRRRITNTRYVQGDEDGSEVAELEAQEGEQDEEGTFKLDWEQAGLEFVHQISTMVNTHVTLNTTLQKALIHFVLNLDNHKTDLSYKAFQLLTQLLKHHPILSRTGAGLVANENIWDFMSSDGFGRQEHAGLMGGKRQYELLHLMVEALHDTAAAAAGQGEPALPGSAGRILLLKYVMQLLRQDLELRLQLAEEQGFSEDARSHVEGAVLFRLMSKAAGASWAIECGKANLVRMLGRTLVYSHIASAAPQPLTAAGRADTFSAGELGSLASELLGLMSDCWIAAERTRAYVRRGAMMVHEANDHVRMADTLIKAVTKDAEYKRPQHLQALLTGLRPDASARLLLLLAAELVGKRAEGTVGSKLQAEMQQLMPLKEYREEAGVLEPPEYNPLYALAYLNTQYAWGRKTLHFNGLHNGEGLGIYVTSLAQAALRARWLTCDRAQLGQLYRSLMDQMVKDEVCTQGYGFVAKVVADRLVEASA